MSFVLASVGWNTLVAAVLALAVLLIGRFWKRPELLHVLWIVVLVKLVTPGIVRWEALPAPPPALPVTLPMVLDVPAVSETAPVEAVASASSSILTPGWTQAPWIVWIGGSVVFFALAMWRLRRFLVALRAASAPEDALHQRVRYVASRLHVSVPRVRVVSAAVPPMIWRGASGALLVLPAELLGRLDPEETDAILAHELAHLKRGDPWVRWVELAVTTVLWWNPLVWWVRQNLRRAEEQACDRRVLEVLPGVRRVYAESIVKTVEFLAGHGRTPVLATGATGTRHIQERLIMILNPAKTRRLRHPLIPALLVAVLALPIIPGFAESEKPSRDEREARERLIALEREALDLERQLHEIQLRRQQIEREMDRTRVHRDSIEMERHAEELRVQGMRDEAAKLEEEVEAMQRRVAEQSERQHEMAGHEREMRDAELQFREALIALEQAKHEGDGRAVKDHQRAVEMYERALEQSAQQQAEAHEAYETAERMSQEREMAETLESLEIERRALEEQGRDDEAERLSRALSRIKRDFAEQYREQRVYEERETVKRDKLHMFQANILAQLADLDAAMADARDTGSRDELEAKAKMLRMKLQEIEHELQREQNGVR